MQRRRRRVVVVLRKMLTCAICTIALVGLLSVHVHVFPSSRVSDLPDPYKLPTVSQQHELNYQKLSTQREWTQELAPPHLSKEQASPHLSKAPLSSHKLDGARGNLDFEKLWKPPANRDFVPCVQHSSNYAAPDESRGYLLVHTNGGLNQMRAGICDMVAVARIINATLVVPELDKRSYWQDSSNFSDVFDEDHFINALANDVKVIKKLPKELSSATKVVKQFKSWSGLEYYQDEIASLWEEYQVIRAAKSDSRLANNNLPPDIQKLRCRACYEALRFAPKIEAMGKLLVDRMRSYGPFIALHLRYEKDMLAFSGCTQGLSNAEAEELKTIRENTVYWKVKEIDAREQRSKGYCPLTPKEVGIFLTALGYPSNTPIYIAAGEIYGGDTHMADLRSHYPMLMSKEKLASVEELEPFTNHASQMAALDYIVSVESDVFIPSYSGNMARAVEGHRRFLGHRKTISPDRKALVRLFDKLENGVLKEGRKLSSRIIEIHKKLQGSPRKRRGPVSGTKGMDRFRSEEAFYVNPLPDCLCRRVSQNVSTSISISWQCHYKNGDAECVYLEF
ncbi:O-fucosyltransferase family protein [Theobroma cacao]|uniref:O-fucosyltransferase family protein n=1 Tax=Theobroma cacao TaxID=3641 RepID=A0A061FG90_THECC|nr:O-fucosyltransferase family protein [Theobroma cacao]